jgi:four helix bundle protein
MRRARSSIPANIAEGCGRSGEPEFGRFLHIGLGSASELEYHVLLAHDLSFMAQADYNNPITKISEIKRMLASLTQRLKADRGS